MGEPVLMIDDVGSMDYETAKPFARITYQNNPPNLIEPDVPLVLKRTKIIPLDTTKAAE